MRNMQQSHKQNGSVHVIVAVILAVALLGSLGFTFYQNFIAKKASDSSATVKDAPLNQAEPVNSEADKVNTETKIDTSKYLVLDDWSVKFTLPQDGTGILYQKYAYTAQAIKESYDTYIFTTKVVNDMGGECAISTERANAAPMVLERRSQKYADGPAAQMPLNNGEQLGGYYYYIRPAAGSACSPADETKIVAEREILRQFARSIQVK